MYLQYESHKSQLVYLILSYCTSCCASIRTSCKLRSAVIAKYYTSKYAKSSIQRQIISFQFVNLPNPT
jgi:hypothetical protein